MNLLYFLIPSSCFMNWTQMYLRSLGLTQVYLQQALYQKQEDPRPPTSSCHGCWWVHLWSWVVLPYFPSIGVGISTCLKIHLEITMVKGKIRRISNQSILSYLQYWCICLLYHFWITIKTEPTIMVNQSKNSTIKNSSPFLCFTLALESITNCLDRRHNNYCSLTTL